MMATPLQERLIGGRSMSARRLLVTQRDPSVPAYRALGFLSQGKDGLFTFAYIQSAVEAPWFIPLPGLSRTDGPYLSPRLFPLFAERVVSPRRPDRPMTLRALDLESDATPFEVLSRSGGRRVEDQIELTPVPVPDARGEVEFDFLVHGVRYTSPEAQACISRLRPGDPLLLQHEPSNAFNPLARLVLRGGLTLGYVPDPLVSTVHHLRNLHAAVLRANGPEVGFHMRLLVRLNGIVGGAAPFTGPEWATVEGG